MNHTTHLSKNHLAASIYATKYGWHVFPTNGKTPITKNGHLDASNDQESIRKLWSGNPHANVAVALKPSGLCVLDLDSKPDVVDAYETLRELEAEFGELPTTPHVLTPRRGMHFYFQTSTAMARHIGVRPGVDVLGDGFAVLPPSKGANGGVYEWECMHRLGDIPIAEMPSLLNQLLGTANGFNESAAAWDKSFQDVLLGLGGGIGVGLRNDAIARICSHLLRRYVDEHLVCHIIYSLNETKLKPPLEEKEIQRTIDSIAKRERKRRQSKAVA